MKNDTRLGNYDGLDDEDDCVEIDKEYQELEDAYIAEQMMTSEMAHEMKALMEENHKLRELAEMVMDNTKMPHQHTDPQLRLYCLAERAKEALGETK
jgi:hypothetical protein